MAKRKHIKRRRLAVIVLGEQNSGKSSVWQALFDKDRLAPRDRNNVYSVSLTEAQLPGDYGRWIEAALIYSSCTETGKKIQNRLPGPLPDVVLCSAQYNKHEISTFDFFYKHGYDIKVLLLRPGANGDSIDLSNTTPNFVDLILEQYEGFLVIRAGGSGRKDSKSQQNAHLVREMILGWSEV